MHMNKKPTREAELLTTFEDRFQKVPSITDAPDPFTAQDLIDHLNQLLSFELTMYELNELINELDIERKLIGSKYYLLITTK